MSHYKIVVGVIFGVFISCMALDLTPCVFPRGKLNGHCVECPVDTLYEYVESFSYQLVVTGFWRHYIKKDESYHRCVKECSPKYPYIGSSRKCLSNCSGNKVQRGNRKYCRDENINNGFCNVNDCPVQEFKCYFMQCLTVCPFFTVTYNHSCVIECFNDKPFIINGECVKRCSERYVLDNGVCQMTCLDGRYNFNNTCVDKCPRSKEYVSDNVCVSECLHPKMYQNKVCVDNCSESFVLDGRDCRTECPSGHFEYRQKCVKFCPESTLEENQKCVKNCSNGFFQVDNQCVLTCPQNYFVNESSKTCVTICKQVKYYENNNTLCLNDCPEKTVEVNSTCMSHCPKRQPFLHGKSCFSRCPDLYRFVEKKLGLDNSLTYICVEKCLKYSSSVSNLCVDACSSGEVLSQEICQEECPNSDPYKVHLPATLLEGELNISTSSYITNPINAFVVCATECPSNFVNDNGECYVDCPNAKKNMIFNSSCLQHCPEDYSFIIKKNNNYLCTSYCDNLRFRHTCLDRCPGSHPAVYRGECVQCSQIRMYEQNQTCVNNCDVVRFKDHCYNSCPQVAKYVYNGICIESCPSNASKVDEQHHGLYRFLVCTDKCPDDKFIYGTNCVSNCPNPNTALHRGECIQCSQIGLYEENKTCVNNCSVVRFKDHCYNSCPKDAKYVYNGICFESCPPNASKVDEQYSEQLNIFVCMKACPSDKFLFGNHCVHSCPDSKRLPIQSKCMACHDVGKYDDGSKCVDECPDLRDEFRCVSKYCPQNLKIFNKTCVPDCPAMAPFVSDITSGYLSQFECVESCKDKTYMKNNRCVQWCGDGFYVYNKTCIKKCPDDAPLISISEDFIYNEECLQQCKESYFSLNNKCLKKCPEGYFADAHQCIRSCTSKNPYRYGNLCVQSCRTLRLGMNCYDKCPPKTFQYNDKSCVQDCPSITPYNYKGKCVQVCKYFLIKKTCHEECPYGLVGYQKKCHLKCSSEAKYRYKWECFKKCPNITILNPLKSVCFDSCPHGKLKYQQICYNRCPLQAPYNFKGECVKSCDGYLDGFKCYKQCPTGRFVFNGKCIPKCPQNASFIDSKRCVSSCPYFHDDYLNCIRKCPKYSYPHGKHCRNGCPSSLPFINSRYDHDECLEKCDSFKYATENYSCIYHSECSAFIYDDTWCFQKCPSNAYILRSKDKLCKSLKPVYIMICILSVIVSINVVFGVRVLCHYIKMRLDKKQRIVRSENAGFTEEINLLEIIET